MAKTKTKEKYYRFQIANIKLQSNSRKGDEAYIDILSKIKEYKVSIPVLGTTHVILRTQFKDKVLVDGKEIDIIYGKISKYTVIDGKDWINLSSMEVENVDLPPNFFPNLKETDYIFIPSAHRFTIVLTKNFNINAVVKFLEKAVASVINSDEQHVICIDQDEDPFCRITKAELVKKLLIEISYSNADTGDEAYAFMDNEIRGSQMGKLKLDAVPNHTKSIKTDSVLVSGALKVAQSNGFVQATIVEEGKNIKVNTKEHPRIIPVVCEETAMKLHITTKIMNMFRSKSNNNDKS